VSSIISLAVLVIAGVIVADILTHPTGTAAASSGLASIEKTNFNQLISGT
jgi:hypothetical protein